MFGLALEGCRELQALVLGKLADWHDVGYSEASLGERARLVEHHGLKVPGALERTAITDQQSVACRKAGAHRDDQRDGVDQILNSFSTESAECGLM